MEKSDELLIEKHIGNDAELRRYVEEHRQYEDELEVFNRRIHLTAEEEVRRKVLQKMKLLGKEKIYSILEKYRRV
jgi:uncharacterized protein YdcH (DUF465 family)